MVLVRLNALTAPSTKMWEYSEEHPMTSSPTTTLAGRNSIASRVMVFLEDKRKTLAFRQIDRQDRIIEQKRKISVKRRGSADRSLCKEPQL